MESSRISNLQFCSKPPLVFKRPQQSYEVTWRRGTLDLDSKRTISPHVFCFRPLLPLPHLSETATWDAHVPVSQGPCVRPDGKVGGGKAGDARAQQDPRASLALRLLCPSGLCSRLPRAAAQSSAACARIKHRMVCFCGCLSPSSRPPASPSLRVPLLLQAYPTLLPQQKQPLVFPLCFAPSSQPLSQSAPGSLLCVRFVPGSPVLPRATWPVMLGGWVAWIAWISSVNLSCPSPAAARGLHLLPLPLSMFSASVSLSVGRGTPSTPLDLTGMLAAAVDFRSPNQTARHKVFCRKAAIVPPPPLFLCPVVEVFSNSVVFCMQINYFKNCFCKYLCEYFSIVFDNIQHFHDLVIAFAGVFKIP